MAEAIGITERAAQAIVNDLEEAGYIRRSRIGRRNRYVVQRNRPFRHPADADHVVDELLTLFLSHNDPTSELDSADTDVVASFAAEPPPDDPEED